MKLAQKLLSASLISAFLISVTMTNLAFASPTTYFWIDPPLLNETPNGTALVKIMIEDAPLTYAWEISLGWNPDRLELVYISRGDFLSQPPPTTPSFTWNGAPSFDEANLVGEIHVVCSLVGDVSWKSGDGRLVNLGFVVQKPGDAYLNLFDTSLYDHIDESTGYPAPTYYDNQDSLIAATNFYYAGLTGWKLKVNGKAGVGQGIKTTVGTANLLEAFFNNTGVFTAQVKAFFEIRDAAGYWIATVESTVATLLPGEDAILSTYWTANGAGTYYITAYSFYSAPPFAPTITVTDGFSRTLRLRAEL